jgi:hypothetical protein
MPECRCRTEGADYRKKCRCRTNFSPAFRHDFQYYLDGDAQLCFQDCRHCNGDKTLFPCAIQKCVILQFMSIYLRSLLIFELFTSYFIYTVQLIRPGIDTKNFSKYLHAVCFVPQRGYTQSCYLRN